MTNSPAKALIEEKIKQFEQFYLEDIDSEWGGEGYISWGKNKNPMVIFLRTSLQEISTAARSEALDECLRSISTDNSGEYEKAIYKKGYTDGLKELDTFRQEMVKAVEGMKKSKGVTEFAHFSGPTDEIWLKAKPVAPNIKRLVYNSALDQVIALLKANVTDN